MAFPRTLTMDDAAFVEDVFLGFIANALTSWLRREYRRTCKSSGIQGFQWFAAVPPPVFVILLDATRYIGVAFYAVAVLVGYYGV